MTAVVVRPERAGDHELLDWAPAESAQVLLLQSYDPTTRGRVVCPAAFDGVDDDPQRGAWT